MMTGSLQVEGQPAPDPHAYLNQNESVAVNYATGDYFKTMGIPLREGHSFGNSDAAGHAVAVVNQVLARRYFPNGNAVGSRVKISGVTDWMEIAGISGNVKQGGLAAETRAEMFVDAAQRGNHGNATTLVLRSTADPRVVMPWLRAQIASVDRDLPPAEIESMRTTMAKLAASQRFVMRLLSLFAAIAISLAGIGIYSVLVYSVERRAHEIGIRLALGAKQSHIAGMVLGRGLRLAAVGSAIGIAGSLALTRYLKSLLYGVKPHDPLTLGAGCGVVLLLALAAAWLPARRALGQDAIATLRSE